MTTLYENLINAGCVAWLSALALPVSWEPLRKSGLIWRLTLFLLLVDVIRHFGLKTDPVFHGEHCLLCSSKCRVAGINRPPGVGSRLDQVRALPSTKQQQHHQALRDAIRGSYSEPPAPETSQVLEWCWPIVTFEDTGQLTFNETPAVRFYSVPCPGYHFPLVYNSSTVLSPPAVSTSCSSMPSFPRCTCWAEESFFLSLAWLPDLSSMITLLSRNPLPFPSLWRSSCLAPSPLCRHSAPPTANCPLKAEDSRHSPGIQRLRIHPPMQRM